MLVDISVGQEGSFFNSRHHQCSCGNLQYLAGLLEDSETHGYRAAVIQCDEMTKMQPDGCRIPKIPAKIRTLQPARMPCPPTKIRRSMALVDERYDLVESAVSAFDKLLVMGYPALVSLPQNCCPSLAAQ
jgi:hypothetical protein